MLGILGGRIYDPRNGKDGEVGDVWVKDGRIVAPEEVDREAAQIVDAAGLVVMPGGVDIHAHIVGGEVNSGRKLQPEDHRGHERARSGDLRAGVGGTVPSTHLTGYLYSELGYTTVMQASAAPLAARHVHEELEDVPNLDKGAFTSWATTTSSCSASPTGSSRRRATTWPGCSAPAGATPSRS